MAYSPVSHVGDGTETDFTLDFSYIQKAHVKASVDGTETEFTWASPSSIRFDTAPASGAVVLIYRDSSVNSLLPDFADGRNLASEVLDISALQAFYLAQERSFVTATGSTNARPLEDRFADVINVKDFGAVGDGETDDTAAIQAALDYAMGVRATQLSDPITSTPVFIPSGTYLVSSTLKIDGDNFLLFGAGVGSTALLRTSDYGNTVELRRPRDTDPTGHLQYRITLRDFAIESQSLPTSGAHIYSVAARGLTIDNVVIRGAAHQCLTLVGSSKFFVKGLYFEADADLYSAFTPTESYKFVYLARNGSGATDYSSYHCEGVLFGCGMESSSSVRCFYVCYDIQDADGVWINDCYARKAQYANFRIKPSDANSRVGGVRIHHCWGDHADSVGIVFEGDAGVSSTHSINDVRLWGNEGEQSYGVVINSDVAKEIKVNNCQISDNNLEGIDVRSFAGDVSITNNRIWSGNLSQTASTAAIKVDANLSNFEILNNSLCGDTSGGAGDEVYGVLIDTGTSDNYMVVGNNCIRSTSGAKLVDNGTGANKVVANNLV